MSPAQQQQILGKPRLAWLGVGTAPACPSDKGSLQRLSRPSHEEAQCGQAVQLLSLALGTLCANVPTPPFSVEVSSPPSLCGLTPPTLNFPEE